MITNFNKHFSLLFFTEFLKVCVTFDVDRLVEKIYILTKSGSIK